jgi:DNA-binding response OmpR family regulator
VVLLDPGLPDMDGTDVVKALARLRAAVRRTETVPLTPETTLVTTADFTIDLPAKKAIRAGRAMCASPPGVLPGATGPTICACTWPSCAASWKRTRPAPAT